MDYSIRMGNPREDNSIFYSEKDTNRNLVAAVDIRHNVFGADRATLYLLSFRTWEHKNEEMSLKDYAVVLSRVFNFLEKKGFQVDFNAEDPGWCR